MQRILYSFILYLAVPLIVIRLLLRSLKAPLYRRRIAERFAWFRPPQNFDSSRQTIWIHAVSVGETIAAIPLIREIQQRNPNAQIYVTTMTPTGSDRVKRLFGDSVFHSYLPYDLPGALSRFINRINPSLLLLMETELWPNTIHFCHKKGVKIVLVNARLSARSANAYARFPTMTRAMLGKIDCITAQTQADARRFIELGASEDRVVVTGSLKFSIEISKCELLSETVFKSITESGRTVVIAASTREGEEIKVLRAFRLCLQAHPTTVLLLIPRHPERFDKVASLCKEQGFVTARRSMQEPLEASVQVYLGDSMGEMFNYFSCADIAFVGGSLVDTGCQNVLEPAAMSLPVVVGPSQFNFATICAQLEQAGALKTVRNERELGEFLSELIDDRSRQEQMGLRGKQLVDANQDALPTLMAAIDKYLVD